MNIVDLEPEKKNGKIIYRRKFEATETSDIDSIKGRTTKYNLLRAIVDNVELWRIPLSTGQFQRLTLLHDSERWVLTIERQEDAT